MGGEQQTDVALLGVRHHGPGSARAVLAALEQVKPEVLLVEGPPEADVLVRLAAHEDMRPPVALLAHVVTTTRPSAAAGGAAAGGGAGGGTAGRAAFWPFAEFSPEWVAVRWAVERDVPVRFIDLPAAHSLAADPEGEREEQEQEQEEGAEGTQGEGDGAPERREARVDPIAVLARAAGHDDPERWWEDVVEHRLDHDGDALAPFAALAEAMAALRERCGDGGHGGTGPRSDAVREAHMRLRVRDARRAYDRVAVVCGAWHVPALADRVPVGADRQLLKGLPKVKVGMTWVPWTHRRLGHWSGYGAGIESPGWYRHLFTSPDRPLVRWMTRVAGLLREEDRPVSSAHVIEAVRLADTLAAVRGRPLPGLGEATDAVRAVMCEGSDVPLALVHDRMVVGDDIGEVPDEAPAVPLHQDLTRLQRTLRLKPEAHERELDLDLRKDTDAARSRLLHRLRLLGVPWGEPTASRTGSTGTFRESWRLSWEPELAVRVAEAGVWGTTVLAAASAYAEDRAEHASGLAGATALAEQCLLAGLPDALPAVMRAVADRAALDADVGHLARALPALVRSARYGDVRGTDTTALRRVAEGLAERIRVGLPPACTGLDADGAAQMRGHLDDAHAALSLLAPARDPLRERWADTLRTLAGREDPSVVPGLLRGRAARILLDDDRLTADDTARLMGLALSAAAPPADAAAWIEGFLAGGGMLLVHDERLLPLLDGWLASVPAHAFTDVLPLLRRTFAGLDPGVRRTVGELARRLAGGGTAGAFAGTGGTGVPGFADLPDPERAEAVLPVLRLLLGRAPAAPAGAGAAGGHAAAPQDHPTHPERTAG
ncbi:DUF5682 family protein [Streptomyces sp. HB2AG]|uniref:DUF5682 family protein n=1 Tax=Streptomyces sp. HB2AG TaxID=2983400 RepID=UPI0022AA360F|nr:DUF5682 family protein [Streptomyces sp. HB2AG]MCZ2523614.1 DUF5682 family protein [Streptomyces sp. HB2AG]